MPTLKNPKHELFAQSLATGAGARKAYSDAGYEDNRKNVWRLKTNKDVAARVLELQLVFAKTAEISLESVCRELDEAVATAKARGQAAPLVNAASLRARLGGLLVEKVELTQADPFEQCKTTTEVCARMLKDLARDRRGGEGFEFSDEDVAAADALLHRQIAEIDEFVASCLARSVNPPPNRLTPAEIEHKRLVADRNRTFSGNGR